MSTCYYLLNMIMKAEITQFWRHWLFVNMLFTKEDKILIKNLFELKFLNHKHINGKNFPVYNQV